MCVAVLLWRTIVVLSVLVEFIQQAVHLKLFFKVRAHSLDLAEQLEHDFDARQVDAQFLRQC
jgi:hypothetical protein